MEQFTKVHYYAFLLDAFDRFPNEGRQVQFPHSLMFHLGARFGMSFKRQHLGYVIGQMRLDGFLSDASTGLFVEFGVHNGATITKLARLLPDQQIYGFDSFQGFPDDGRADWAMDFSVENPPEVPKNVKLIGGFFDETLELFKAQISKVKFIKFAHIDCDIYSSTRDIFDNLGELFQPGTVILFDELIHYGKFDENEFLAFYEFLLKNKLDFVWYLKCGKIMEFGQFCAQKELRTIKDFRKNGYLQYAAIQLTSDRGLNLRLEKFEQEAARLSKARVTGQILSPTYSVDREQ